MISASLTRRLALLAALSSALWLAACNGDDGDGNGNTTIRAINLTSDIPGIDLYTGDTKRFSALATDTVSSNVTLEANSYTLNVKKAGEGTTLRTGTYSLSKDKHYTAVVWGRESGLEVSTLPEDENTGDIAEGNSRIRFFSATRDAGSLDIYLTESTTDLGESLPSQGTLTAGSLSAFRDVSAKTYRLRVTGAGDPGDVRLDVPTITLASKTYNTLVLTAGASGVLLNGTLIAQQGNVTTMRSNKARVRVVASVAGNANVAATLGGTTLAGGIRSPAIGPYALVDAGSQDLTVRVAGNVVSTGARSFVAGTDYTVLAYGPDPAGGTPATVRLVTDDNRLPASTGRMKIQLINGVFGLDPATLSIDLAAVATDVAAGNASGFSTLVSNAEADVTVTTSSGIAALFSDADVNLQSLGVYTVFLLGGNSAPTGVIRKER